MPKLLHRLISVIVAFCIVITVSPALAEDYSNRIIRVGLFFGSTALPGANLQNSTGSGYRLGYFDASGTFIKLGFVGNTKISVLMDSNMCLSGGNYIEGTSSPVKVGAYHIELPNSFSTYEDALAAADTYKSRSIPAFPAYVSGSFRVRIEHFSSAETAQSEATSLSVQGNIVGEGKSSYTVVDTETGEILFEFDAGSDGKLGIMPSASDSDRPVTWCRGYKYGGGFEYSRKDGKNISVINLLSVQEYARGVVPYELSTSWPLECLKVEAVCAKTFALANWSKHKADGFNVCTTIDCQVYKGLNLATDKTDQAVSDTAGYFVFYSGQPANTVYHSTNGGSTESSLNVWGTDVPYLQPVSDPFETLTVANNGLWQFEVSTDQLTSILTGKGYPNSGIVDFFVEKYTDAGNVLRIVFVDSSGKRIVFERERCRTILNGVIEGITVNSQRFKVYPKGSAPSAPISSGASSALSSDVYVKSSKGVSAAPGERYAIDGSGNVKRISDQPLSVLSSSGASGGSAQTKAGTDSSNGSGTVFVVDGRGWGHNVGLSQWGSRGMVEKGYKFDEILKYYFKGITLTQ